MHQSLKCQAQGEIELDTKRLLIRAIELQDVESIVCLWTNPKVTEHLGGPKDAGVIREYSIELATDPDAVFAEEGDRWWSVCLRDSGEWIGKCALLSKEVEGQQEIELNYFFLPAAWGHGYATEAARCIADHALEQLAFPSVVALIDPANKRSSDVALRVGLTLEKTTPRPGDVVRDIYRIRSSSVSR